MIKEFEGCKLTAYCDPLTGDRPYTIGWGSTRKKDGSSWELGDRITQKEADDLLEWQIENKFLPALKHVFGWGEMNPNQRGALLSFTWNVGTGWIDSPKFTTINKVIKAKNWAEVPSALLRYINPGTNVTEGLRRRRIAEGGLWRKSVE